LPLTVKFTDTSTVTDDLAPVTWEWDFGDGNTSTEQNPTNTYKNAGTFNVSLIVNWPVGSVKGVKAKKTEITEKTEKAGEAAKAAKAAKALKAGSGDEESGMRIIRKEGLINVLEPIKAEIMAYPRKGESPLEVNFTDISTGTVVSREWDFGDGNTASPSEKTTTHTYTNNTTAAKQFNAKLTVKGPRGESDTGTAETQISVAPKSRASFIMSLNQNMSNPVKSFVGYAPITLFFKDTSVGAQNPQWNFGDEKAGVVPTVNHRYTSPRTFTVTLVSGGSQATGIVKLFTRPTLTFKADKTANVRSGDPVNFTYNIKGDFSSSEIQFGDGITTKLGGRMSGIEPHRYTAFKNTTYTALFIVEGSAGSTERKAVNISVNSSLKFGHIKNIGKIFKVEKADASKLKLRKIK